MAQFRRSTQTATHSPFVFLACIIMVAPLVADDGTLPLYRWDAGDDAFESCSSRDELTGDLADRVDAGADDFAAAWCAREQQLTDLVREGVRDYVEVRGRLLQQFERPGGLS